MKLFGFTIKRNNHQEPEYSEPTITLSELRTLLAGAEENLDDVIARAKAFMQGLKAKSEELTQLAGNCRQSAQEQYAQAIADAQTTLQIALAGAQEMEDTANQAQQNAANISGVFSSLGLNDPASEDVTLPA